MRLSQPNIKLSARISRNQQGERLNKPHQRHIRSVSVTRSIFRRLINWDNSLVVPNSNTVIATACCDQVQVHRQITTNDILLMSFHATTEQIVDIVEFFITLFVMFLWRLHGTGNLLLCHCVLMLGTTGFCETCAIKPILSFLLGSTFKRSINFDLGLFNDAVGPSCLILVSNTSLLLLVTVNAFS